MVFPLLLLGKQLTELRTQLASESHQTPGTPSGMKPPYQKPPSKGRKKPAGQKQGHVGHCGPPSERIDHRKKHEAECCPRCGGRLRRCGHVRTRYTEDIPQVQPEVTAHRSLPGLVSEVWEAGRAGHAECITRCTLGNRVLMLSALLHYALGNPLIQIVEVFKFLLVLLGVNLRKLRLGGRSGTLCGSADLPGAPAA